VNANLIELQLGDIVKIKGKFKNWFIGSVFPSELKGFIPSENIIIFEKSKKFIIPSPPTLQNSKQLEFEKAFSLYSLQNIKLPDWCNLDSPSLWKTELSNHFLTGNIIIYYFYKKILLK